MFWRLHGWLDARWTEMRQAQGLSDQDPVYKAAIAKAQAEMAMLHHCCPKGTVGATLGDEIPLEARKFMENDGL
jgi:hypothetical protein